MAQDPVIAQKGPYQVDLKAGEEYYFCRCGRSKNQPFCDGSHEGTGLEPQAFKVDADGTYNLCGCKTSDDMPFCDGMHNML